MSLAQEAAQIVSSGCEAAFIDPFYFGESHPAERDYLHALLIAGVGDRPLRLQVSEVLQAASLIWATTGTESKSRLTLKAVGPRSSLISLLVGAIQPSTVGKVEISVSMKSLQDVIEKDMKVEQAPELFCFGLLESFDIDQLKALAGPTVIETD